MNDSKKIVLITGVSSGIGLSIAKVLLKKKYQVIGTVRNLNSAKENFSEGELKEIQLEKLDVTSAVQIKSLIRKIRRKFNSIDVLINNAGFGIGGFIEEQSIEEIRQQFEANFFWVNHDDKRIDRSNA